jgi:hypothetical protein
VRAPSNPHRPQAPPARSNIVADSPPGWSAACGRLLGSGAPGGNRPPAPRAQLRACILAQISARAAAGRRRTRAVSAVRGAASGAPRLGARVTGRRRLRCSKRVPSRVPESPRLAQTGRNARPAHTCALVPPRATRGQSHKPRARSQPRPTGALSPSAPPRVASHGAGGLRAGTLAGRGAPLSPSAADPAAATGAAPPRLSSPGQGSPAGTYQPGRACTREAVEPRSPNEEPQLPTRRRKTPGAPAEAQERAAPRPCSGWAPRGWRCPVLAASSSGPSRHGANLGSR